MQSQVHGIYCVRYNGIIDHAHRRRVICLYWRRGLRPSHINQSVAHWNYFIRCYEEGSEFSFGHGIFLDTVLALYPPFC